MQNIKEIKMRSFLSLTLVLIGTSVMAQIKVKPIVPVEYKTIEMSAIDGIKVSKNGKDFFKTKEIKAFEEGINLKEAINEQELFVKSEKGKQFYITAKGKKAFKKRYDRCYPFVEGKAKVIEKGYTKIIDQNGEVVFGGSNDSILFYTDLYALVIRENKIIAIDNQNKRVEERDFAALEYLGNNRMGYKEGDRIGLINNLGKAITPARFENLKYLDPIYYYQEDGIRGFLNSEGEPLLDFQMYQDRGNGVYYGFKGGFGLINSKGALMTDYIYKRIAPIQPNSTYSIAVLPNNQKVILDKEGNKIGDTYHSISSLMSGEFINWLHVGKGESNFNLMNLKGETFFQQDSTGFAEVQMITNDVAKVKVLTTDTIGYRFALVDRNRNFLAPAEYSFIDPIGEGVYKAAKVVVKDGEVALIGGYLNEKGTFLAIGNMVPSRFSKGYSVYNVLSKSGKKIYGCVDKDLNVFLSHKDGYSNIVGPINSTFLVHRNGKYTYIDMEGKPLFKGSFDIAKPFDKGIAFADNRFYTKTGEQVLVLNPNAPIATRDKLKMFRNGFAPIRKNEKWGFIDEKGSFITPCKYDKVEFFIDGLAKVYLGNKQGFINENGEEVFLLEVKSIERIPSTSKKAELFIVENMNSKFGLIDSDQKQLLKFEYSTITYQEIDNEKFKSLILLKAEQNDLYGLFEFTQ